MSTTTTALTPVQQIAQIFQQQVATLEGTAIVAAAGPLETFLTWVNANPSGATNPASVGPQIVLLQAGLLAVLPSVEASTVASISGALLSAIKGWAAAAQAALTAATASAA